MENQFSYSKERSTVQQSLPVVSIPGKHFMRNTIFLMKKERFKASGVVCDLGQTTTKLFNKPGGGE